MLELVYKKQISYLKVEQSLFQLQICCQGALFWALLYSPVAILTHIQGVPKKRGISECCSFCSLTQLMLNLESSFLIHLKIEIHMFVQSTKLFLSYISEPRQRFFKYPIWHQLLASSQLSFIKTLLHRLTSTQLTMGHMLSE